MFTGAKRVDQADQMDFRPGYQFLGSGKWRKSRQRGGG